MPFTFKLPSILIYIKVEFFFSLRFGVICQSSQSFLWWIHLRLTRAVSVRGDTRLVSVFIWILVIIFSDCEMALKVALSMRSNFGYGELCVSFSSWHITCEVVIFVSRRRGQSFKPLKLFLARSCNLIVTSRQPYCRGRYGRVRVVVILCLSLCFRLHVLWLRLAWLSTLSIHAVIWEKLGHHQLFAATFYDLA